MGVTAVGIHERSAREKINSSEVARTSSFAYHGLLFVISFRYSYVFSLDVLNDEVQRKFISAVKRLMTFCQQQHPAPPSKSVV